MGYKVSKSKTHCLIVELKALTNNLYGTSKFLGMLHPRKLRLYLKLDFKIPRR